MQKLPLTNADRRLRDALKRLNNAAVLVNQTDKFLSSVQDKAETIEGRQELLKKYRPLAVPRKRLEYLQVRHEQASELILKALDYLRDYAPGINSVAARKAAGYLTRLEMARLCGVGIQVINSGIRFGHFPAPSYRIDGGKRLYYKTEDRHAVEAGLKLRAETHTLQERRKKLGTV